MNVCAKKCIAIQLKYAKTHVFLNNLQIVLRQNGQAERVKKYWRWSEGGLELKIEQYTLPCASIAVLCTDAEKWAVMFAIYRNGDFAFVRGTLRFYSHICLSFEQNTQTHFCTLAQKKFFCNQLPTMDDR